MHRLSALTEGHLRRRMVFGTSGSGELSRVDGQEVPMSVTIPPAQPLARLDQWDDFVEGRYKEGKSQDEFRVYDASATPGVAEFYRLNHEGQTVQYVLGKEKEYFSLQKGM